MVNNLHNKVHKGTTQDALRSEIVEIILIAWREVKGDLSEVMTSKSFLAVQLYGHSSSLDSLGLVRLLIDVEQRVNERYGSTVALMDEKAMSQKHSPFRTVVSLADYLVKLIEGQSG